MEVEHVIDITAEEREMVLSLLEQHLPGAAAWVYGSRAKWTSRPQSDLDLVVFPTSEQRKRVGDLREAFEESNLPFRVDLFTWDEVPESFRRQIEAEHLGLARNDSTTLLDCLPPGWERSTLGSACERGGGNIQTGPFGSQLHASDYRRSGIPSIMPQNIGDNRVIEAGIARIGEGDVRRLARYLVRTGDIVYSRRGDVEKRALIGHREDGWLCGTGCLRVRLGENGVNPQYASYYLGHPVVREWIVRHAHGATMPNLNTAILSACPFLIPPLSEQRAIAHILGTLDDKIELNRRMNATLEAMARALFRSWFVDFDPVRAKMEGRDTGLPKEVANLFPDRLMDSEVGAVPEEWDVGVLDDAVELLNGGTPRTSVERFWNGDIPWYTAKDAPAPHDVFAVETERTITQAGVDNSATVVLPPRTTVISARGSVGQLACLGRPMAMNQTCYGIRGAGGYGDFFTYWLVRGTVDELRSRTHGTIFDTITRQTFALVNLALPPVSIADAFESVVLPIMERILSNLHQSGALAALRDTLLPKLVSGELRVTGPEPSSGRDDRRHRSQRIEPDGAAT
jgi:type I restriction enzyme S subunit